MHTARGTPTGISPGHIGMAMGGAPVATGRRQRWYTGQCISIAKGESIAVAWVHPRQINMAMARKSTRHRQVRRHCMSLQHCRQQGDLVKIPPCHRAAGLMQGRCWHAYRKGHTTGDTPKEVSPWRLGEAHVMQVTPQRCGREGCPQGIHIANGEGSASARIPKLWDN